MRTMPAVFRDLGMTIIPSAANFVMIELASEAQADALVEAMLRQGVVIRPLKAFGLPHCVRVSMGTDEGNEICANAMANAWNTVRNEAAA